jgi:hypothetical protein
MSASNFEFLEEREPELFKIAVTAEEFLHRAPTSCLRELRTFGEMLLKRYLGTSGISIQASKQYDRLEALEKQRQLPERIVRALHQIRMSGNDASHENEGTHERATNQLRNAHAAAAWLCKEIHGAREVAGDFHVPNPDEHGSSENEEGDPHREELEALRRRLHELENRKRSSETSQDRVRHLEARIQDLERNDDPAERAPSKTNSLTSTSSAVWASESGALTVIQGVQRAAQGLWRGLSTAIGCIFGFIWRGVRRVLIVAVVAGVFFYLPPLYSAGFKPLPDDVQTSLPHPEVVAQTHANVLPPATRDRIENAVGKGVGAVRDVSAATIQSMWGRLTASDSQDAAPPNRQAGE